MKRATLLLLFASALYIPYLGHLITYDEVVTVRYFAVSPINALVLWAAPNNHLLHSLFVWMSTSILGRSELAIRLPAFFAALLAIASTYRLGRRMDRMQSGLLGAVIITCTSGFITFATSARGYSLGLFLTVLLIEQMLFPRKTTRLAMLLTMALVLVLPSMVMLIVGVGAWSLWKSRRMVPALVVGAISGGIFYVPSLVWQTSVVDFGLLSLRDMALNFGRLLTPPGLWGLLILLSGVGLLRMSPRQRLLWGSVGLMAVILTLGQWVVLQRLFYARNYLYVFPLLAIPAGMAAARLPQWCRGIIALGWILPSLIWATTQAPITADILPVEPDLPRLLDYIHTELNTGDDFIVGCCIDQPLWYYAANDIDRLAPDGKGRLIVVTTPNATLQQVLKSYNVEATCAPLERWQTITLYECSPSRDVD